MIQQDLVSVCVPTYNGATYIKETINCIISQTYQNLEIIINDDCSTDQTAVIVQEMAQYDSRIKFFENKENLGLVGNWNKCIELSNGKWIKFLFQDDLMTSDCISKMIECNKPFVIASRTFIYNGNIDSETKNSFKKIENKYSIATILKNKSLLTQSLFVKTFCKYPSVNIFGEPSSMLIRKDIFDTVGYFDASLKQVCDLEYWLRAGSCFETSIIPEKLVSFRVHSESTSSNNHSTKRLETLYKDYFILYDKVVNDPIFQNFRNYAEKNIEFLYWEYAKKILLLKYSEPTGEIKSNILSSLKYSFARPTQFEDNTIKWFILQSISILYIAPIYALNKFGGMCMAILKRLFSKIYSKIFIISNGI